MANLSAKFKLCGNIQYMYINTNRRFIIVPQNGKEEHPNQKDRLDNHADLFESIETSICHYYLT